ncbi:DUF1772 domain-containing protein [Bradyrhizobium sp. WSM 1704]|uniref:anthrone oxygenase family protein n=1 Tax=Bradyrhizobium semiaridum TaxID=2821404 RepID=UPI001CE2618E|nr:anthrone oxygenase family protein [Bradyrhizobium semiaridum]MCA6121723.1 DUF1772 domain-containing protein [Bradyrhizobium semiaridum]
MRQLLISALLWFAAVGCGLLGGLYFAFSTFIMTSLGRIGQAAGISAMNAINVDIVRSLFMPLFFATTLACAALAALASLRWQEPGAIAAISGGVLYVVGMFVVTVVFNVPLNNQLAAVDPASSAAAPVWASYLVDWTFWNHVRTIACTGSVVLFIVAIAARSA